MVRLEWAEQSRDKLQENGVEVQYKSYPGLEHSVSPEEVADVQAWLLERLPPEA